MTLQLRLVAIVCAAVVFQGQAIAAPSPLNGSWAGKQVLAGDALRLTMHFKEDSTGWVGSFDSDQLRVAGIPLREIKVSLPSVQWKIVGDVTTTTFRGELHGQKLSGQFDEQGAHGTFELQREKNQEQWPEERELTFRNGPILLSGSLLLPNVAERKAPAALFLHGSGGEGRWASRYLATRFARAGIAALIYDKRGVGQSTGDWQTATPDDLAADAAAAIAQLRSMPMIDPDRIGIYGHSQGGTLAPLVASKAPHMAFIIASAAAGLPPEQVEIYSVENSMGVGALPSPEAGLAHEYVESLVTTAYRGLSHQRLRDLWQQVKGKPWAFEPPPEGDYWWSFSKAFAQYDPIHYWREVRSPVLLVYGEEDQRVPPRASAAAITAALIQAAADSVTVRIFQNADHTLRVPSKGVWPATPPGYPDVLIEWARQVTAVPN
jgi:pimeloyl-ACP methyl ester carboxylesterase